MVGEELGARLGTADPLHTLRAMPSPARRRASMELIGMVAGVEFLLWGDGLPNSTVPRAAATALAIAAIAASFRRRGLRLRLPRRRSFFESWGLAATVTVAAAALVLVVARMLGFWSDGSLHLDATAFASWGNPGWWLHKSATLLLQQLLLLLCVLPLCIEITGAVWGGALLSGLIFGGVHLPNPTLSLLTACAAPVWCVLYLRIGRVIPLLASHLLLVLLVRAACGDAIYSMRIGASALGWLPRTIYAADGSQRRIAPNSLEGFLDSCRPRAQQVVCEGWSADLDRRRPTDALLVLAAGSWHEVDAQRIPRPDVAEQFGLPQLRETGFEVELPTEWFGHGSDPRFFGVAGEQIDELEYHGARGLK